MTAPSLSASLVNEIPQTLLFVGGHPGSGKTELARVIGYSLGWAPLDKDGLFGELVSAWAGHATGDRFDRQSSEYLQDIRPVEYRALMRTAFDILGSGMSVVVDAPLGMELTDPNWCERMYLSAASRGVRACAVWVDCPNPQTRRDRLIMRGAMRDEWKLAHWDIYLESLADPTADSTEPLPLRVITNDSDSLTSLDVLYADVVEWMRTVPVPE